MQPADQLVLSTAQILVQGPSGHGTGTGFFYCFDVDGSPVPALVTNRHVVQGAQKLKILVTVENGATSSSRNAPLEAHTPSRLLIFHPDAKIDLCAIPLQPFISQMTARGDRLRAIFCDEAMLPASSDLQGLSVAEDVLVVGYPVGLFDQVNNFPVVRRGITATAPRLDYNGDPCFLVDAGCYPGSSGSPVFLYNVAGYRLGNNTVLGGPPRVLLLGVVYAGHQFTARGTVEVVTIPTAQSVVSKSSVPMHLGLVLRSEKLRDFIPVLKARLAAEPPVPPVVV